MAFCVFHSFGRFDAFFDGFHHFAEVDEFIADDLVIFIECHAGNIAFGHFQIPRAFRFRTEHGTGLAAQAFAEVVQAGTDGEAAFGEGCLGTAVYNLEEELAHSHVDSIADQVCIEGFKKRFARKDFQAIAAE